MWNLKKNRTILIILVLVTSISICGTKITINAREDSNTDSSSNLAGTTLKIVTRHDFFITNWFKTEFLASDYAINRNVTNMIFYSASTDEEWKKLLEDPSKSIDLAWGGGLDTFSRMEYFGLLKHIDNSTLKSIINSNVPNELAGVSLKEYDTSGDLVWFGNTISSYGFTVNHDFLGGYGLPVPSTWEVLATPTYYLDPSVKAISMGNPPTSTSNARIYQIILRTFGWEYGWSIITRMGANAGIYPGSVDTRAAVVSGDVGIGMTIDYNGIIAQRENPLCEYIIPDSQSSIIPDSIALAINVDNQVGAEAFLEFLVSPEGQSNWLREGLDRLPVNEDAFNTAYGQTRVDMYTLFNDTLANIGIEFNETLAQSYNMISIYYFHETILTEHTKLRNTWGEMVKQVLDGNITSSQFSTYVDDLGETYYTEQEAIDANAIFISDPGLASAMEGEWESFAENKYDLIYESLVSPIPEISPKIQLIYLNVVVILLVSLIRKKRKRN